MVDKHSGIHQGTGRCRCSHPTGTITAGNVQIERSGCTGTSADAEHLYLITYTSDRSVSVTVRNGDTMSGIAQANRTVAAVRMECAIRQHQPDLSGQHRHLSRHVSCCQRIRVHKWSCACRQAWRNSQRHLRGRRMAARRPVEQPRQPQSYLPRSAAPLLTQTIVAFDTMPEATLII